jgi:hypothetical protein
LSNNNSKEQTDQQILQVIKEQKPETVDQLVTLVQQRLSLPKQEILKRVLYLQEKEKIHIIPPQKPTPHAFKAYLRSGRAYWYWITVGLTALTAIMVLIVPDGSPLIVVRAPLGVIYVLWLPGYAFIRALVPSQLPFKAKDKDIDIIERVALSLGLSIALVPLVGLLLNYTPWGIRLLPITLSLAALTLVFATAAIIREYQATKPESA